MQKKDNLGFKKMMGTDQIDLVGELANSEEKLKNIYNNQCYKNQFFRQ